MLKLKLFVLHGNDLSLLSVAMATSIFERIKCHWGGVKHCWHPEMQLHLAWQNYIAIYKFKMVKGSQHFCAAQIFSDEFPSKDRKYFVSLCFFISIFFILFLYERQKIHSLHAKIVDIIIFVMSSGIYFAPNSSGNFFLCLYVISSININIHFS